MEQKNAQKQFFNAMREDDEREREGERGRTNIKMSF